MRAKLMLLFAAGSLLAYSCTKNNGEVHINTPQKHQGSPAALSGEDDHRVIIIVKVFDELNNPLGNSYVVIYNSVDTFSGYTNASGTCSLSVTTLGQWNLDVTHNGYSPSNTMVNLVDSTTTVTRILQQ